MFAMMARSQGLGGAVTGLSLIFLLVIGFGEARAATGSDAHCPAARMMHEAVMWANEPISGAAAAAEIIQKLVNSPHFMAAAEEGDAVAEYILATKGSQDERPRWLRRSAEHGYAIAQADLAGEYHYGRNYPDAAQWYLRAAQHGDVVAMGRLGVLYEVGRGVPQDFIEAHKWYDLAASSAIKSLAERNASSRNSLAARMTLAQVAEAQRRAAVWHAAPEPVPCLKLWEEAKEARAMRETG